MFLYYHRQQIEQKNVEKRLEEILYEIGSTPLLSADEKTALCKAVQEKGMESDVMSQLEKANMRFVVSIANRMPCDL